MTQPMNFRFSVWLSAALFTTLVYSGCGSTGQELDAGSAPSTGTASATVAIGTAVTANTTATSSTSPSSPTLAITLQHSTLEQRIGNPAIIAPGKEYPTVDITARTGGILQVRLVNLELREVVFETPAARIEAGETRTITFPGTPSEGVHTIQIDLYEATSSSLLFRDAYFFTVLDVTTLPSNHSVVAFPGPDGRLRYTPDYRGNRLPDFSMVGYRNGMALPVVPVKMVVEPRSSLLENNSVDASQVVDDTERIQAAIDAVSALPLNEDGFRGAVLLKRGVYPIAGTLHIRASGVVLRGEGQGDFKDFWLDPALNLSLEEFLPTLDDKNATILLATGPELRWIIEMEGPGTLVEIPDTSTEIVNNYLPVGATTLTVQHAGHFSVGDSIIVERRGNEQWISEIGMDRIPSSNDPRGITQWSPVDHPFEFVITAINGTEITLNSGLPNAIELQWGGGRVYRYHDQHRITRSGVEHLRAISFWKPNENGVSDTRHADMFLRMNNLRDGWAQHITMEHFYGRSGIMTGLNTLGITISSSSNLVADREWYMGEGYDDSGRYFAETGVYVGRYGFHLEGQFGLVKNSYGINNRHAFFVGAWVSGPNVFLNSYAEQSLTWSAPHHRWSTAGLFDNVSDMISMMNRLRYGTGHGWAGANYVAWNTEGPLVVQQPPTAQNWSIGHIGELREGPFHDWNIEQFGYSHGFIDSFGARVEPASLYLQQFRERRENPIYPRLGAAPVDGGFAQNDYWVWGSSVIRGEDGNYHMFVSRWPDFLPFQSSMMIGVAKAPSIFEPFEVVGDGPIFGVDHVGEVEDIFLWEDETGFHMLAKDQRGTITGNRHGGILAHSQDGVNWFLNQEPLAYTREVRWSDGETIVMGQLERVFGLLDGGRLTHLFFSTMDGPGGFANGTRSWNMVIPLTNTIPSDDEN